MKLHLVQLWGKLVRAALALGRLCFMYIPMCSIVVGDRSGANKTS